MLVKNIGIFQAADRERLPGVAALRRRSMTRVPPNIATGLDSYHRSIVTAPGAGPDDRVRVSIVENPFRRPAWLVPMPITV